MAYDSDEGHFHLMREGWVREDNEPYPTGRIETWRYSMHQASGWSREYRSLICEWVTSTLAQSERDSIRNKFGWPYGMTRSRDVTIGDPL
jgi:hypothetical protein